MLKIAKRECPCGSYEYALSFKNLGEQDTCLFCPFCGAEDDDGTEKLERCLKKRKTKIEPDYDEEE
jgi:hypothetical protein